MAEIVLGILGGFVWHLVINLQFFLNQPILGLVFVISWGLSTNYVWMLEKKIKIEDKIRYIARLSYGLAGAITICSFSFL